jgi:hypothetical protein
MYLVTSTDFSCFSRIALAMAWFSTLGFHCGSIMKTRFAEVRFRLQRVVRYVCHMCAGTEYYSEYIGKECLPERASPSGHDEDRYRRGF